MPPQRPHRVTHPLGEQSLLSGFDTVLFNGFPLPINAGLHASPFVSTCLYAWICISFWAVVFSHTKINARLWKKGRDHPIFFFSEIVI